MEVSMITPNLIIRDVKRKFALSVLNMESFG